MPHVSEHHSEEERESNCGENSRVDLLVARNTVRVSDFLGDHRVAVCVEGCRGLGGCQFLNLRGRSDSVDPVEEVLPLALGQVHVSHKEVLLHDHLVQSLVDESFLPKIRPPCLQTVPIGNHFQILFHFAFIELDEIVHFLELVATSTHLGSRLLPLLELEKRCGKCLHDSV